MKDNPYSVSQVELIDRVAPEAFIEQWSVTQLRVLGWLAVVYAIARFIDLLYNTVRIFIPLPSQYIFWPSITAAVLNCYLMFYALRLIQSRFKVPRGFRWPVYLLMILPFLIELGKGMIADRLESTLVLFSMDGPLMAYLGLVLLAGILDVVFGIMLLNIRRSYRCIKVCGWFMIMTGILIVSVFFIPFTLFTALVVGIAFARIFFCAANELESEMS